MIYSVLKNKVAVTALVLVLFGCAEVTESEQVAPSEYFQFSSDPKVMKTQLIGRTAKFDSPGHGTQIEYFDRNGKAYLWYPGNSRAVPSQWKTLPRSGSRKYARICFIFPSTSYNPVTKSRGGLWVCRPSNAFAFTMTALFDGDEFNLSSGRIPKPMPRGAILDFGQLERLLRREVRPKFVYKRAQPR